MNTVNYTGVFCEYDMTSEIKEKLKYLSENENIHKLIRIADMNDFEVIFDLSKKLFDSYCHVNAFKKVLYIGVSDLNLNTIHKAIIVLAHECGHIFGSKTESEASSIPEKLTEEILAWKVAKELIKGFFNKNKLEFLELSDESINSRVYKLTSK